MKSDGVSSRDRWVMEAMEQARIILAHLEDGGKDDDFLRPHRPGIDHLQKGQSVGTTGRRYLL
jgi:hypothetical protein